jgi:hypothetical protein
VCVRVRVRPCVRARARTGASEIGQLAHMCATLQRRKVQTKSQKAKKGGRGKRNLDVFWSPSPIICSPVALNMTGAEPESIIFVSKGEVRLFGNTCPLSCHIFLQFIRDVRDMLLFFCSTEATSSTVLHVEVCMDQAQCTLPRVGRSSCSLTLSGS